MQASWRPEPGTILGGRYTLERQIGLGPTSAVYSASDRQAAGGASDVIVKVFHAAFFTSARRGPNTMRLQRARAYSHPRLVPLRDVQIAGVDNPFVVTDLVADAMPLERWILGRMPLATDQVRQLIVPMAEALEAVHLIGVCGNLKPSNVFVTESGELTLTDPWFLEGRADVTPGELPERSGHWLAPEQRTDAWAERPETDVYRLGLMLGWLMAGRTVVGGRSLIRQRVMVPQSVDEVFVKATTVAPEDRYSDVVSFKEALAAAWTAEDWTEDDELGLNLDTVIAVVESEIPLVAGETADPADAAPADQADDDGTELAAQLLDTAQDDSQPAVSDDGLEAVSSPDDGPVATDATSGGDSAAADTAAEITALDDMTPEEAASDEAAADDTAPEVTPPEETAAEDPATPDTAAEAAVAGDATREAADTLQDGAEEPGADALAAAAFEEMAADAELITDFEIIEESVVGPLGDIVARYGPGAPDNESVPALPIDFTAVAAGAGHLRPPAEDLSGYYEEAEYAAPDHRIGNETEAIPLDEIVAMGLDPQLGSGADEVAAVVYPDGVTESVELDAEDVVELLDEELVEDDAESLLRSTHLSGPGSSSSSSAPVLMDLIGPGGEVFDPASADSTRTVQVVPGPGSARALEAARVADERRRSRGTTADDIPISQVGHSAASQDDERQRSAIVWIAPLLVVIAALFMFWVLGEVSKRRQEAHGGGGTAARIAHDAGAGGAAGVVDAKGDKPTTPDAASSGPTAGTATPDAGVASAVGQEPDGGAEAASDVALGAVTGEALGLALGDADAPAVDGVPPTSDAETAEAGPAPSSGDVDAATEVAGASGPDDPEIPEDMERNDYKCPGGMSRIRGTRRFITGAGAKVKRKVVWCADRHEYPGKGSVPQTNVSLGQARSICSARGKRLCTKQEWRGACGGKYPYGREYEPGRCNTVGTDGMPKPVLPAGSRPACKGGFGTYDMVGNVAEWTSGGAVNGGSAYKDGESASCYRSGRRSGGSPYVGFRCCADPILKVKDPAAADKP